MRAVLIVLATLVFGAVLVAVVALVAGRDLIVHGALRLGTDSYSLQAIDGTLTGELELRGLQLEAAGNSVTAGRIALDVSWRALLAGRPGLDRLVLEDAQITPAAGEDVEPLSFSLPALPDVFVRNIELDNVSILPAARADAGEPPGTAVTVKRVRGGFDSSPTGLQLDQLSVDVMDVQATANGRLPATGEARSGLKLTVAAGDVRADIDINGSLAAPTGRAALNLPDVAAAFAFALDPGGQTLPVRVRDGQVTAGEVRLEALSANLEVRAAAIDLADVTATLNMPGQPRVALGAAGTLADFERFNGNLTASTEGAQIAADVDANIATEHVQASLDAQLDNLWHWLKTESDAPLPVQATATLSVTGFATPSIDVPEATARFRWQDLPGTLRASGSTGPAGTRANAALTWADRTTTASLENNVVTADLALADIGLLLPGSRGELSGMANVQLEPGFAPRAADVQIHASNLSQGNLSASAADVVVRWKPDAPLNAQLQAKDVLAYAGATPYQVSASASGQANAFSWRVAADGAELVAAANGKAVVDVNRGAADIEVAALDLNVVGVDRLQLAAPAKLQIEPAGALTAAACLVGEQGARVCVDSNPKLSRVRVQKLTDHVWMPLLVTALPSWPGRLALRGAISAEVDYAPGGNLTAHARLEDGALLVDDGTGGADNLLISVLSVSAVGNLADPRKLTTRLALQLAEVGELAADVSVTGERLDGTVQLKLPDLSPLALLAPEIEDLTGSLGGELRLAGTIAAPRFDTDLNLRGQMRIVPLAITLRDIKVDVHGSSAASLVMTGSAASGDGTISLDGTLNDLMGTPNARIKIAGDNALVVAQPDLLAAASPQLELVWDDRGLLARGRVDINRARVVVKPSFSSSIVLSEDVVIHGDAPPEAPPLPLRADVRLDLGGDTRVTAGPIDTGVTGGIRLTREPGRPQRLVGSVAISGGEYELYGVKLNIERGRLDFAGPADNPAVQLRASRRITDSQLVGIDVSGFLQRLQTQVFSDPPQAEADTLAMLVTGRTFAEASSGSSSNTDLNRIGNAAASLGLGATGIVSRVRERVGLDELALSNPLDREQTAVMLGKQLTERLYVRYAYSLFNRTGGLLLRYQVLPNLSLQSEVGEARALDLIYSRQFD